MSLGAPPRIPPWCEHVPDPVDGDNHPSEHIVAPELPTKIKNAATTSVVTQLVRINPRVTKVAS